MEARPVPLPRSFTLSADIRTVRALLRRSANEIMRVPGAAIPGVMAPTIFFLGLTAVFGSVVRAPGFTTDSYASFIISVSLLQGAGFTGAATGVNLARDIEQGWFDRLLASPAPRPVLLAGLVVSAGLRALVPATVVLSVGFAIGVHWPGLPGLLLALFLTMSWGVVSALWGVSLALKFKSQAAAPLMQSGMFVAILFTSAYAPIDQLQGWLEEVARLNPVNHILEASRQGFVTGGLSWGETWPGLLALAGIFAVMAAFALRGMSRTTD